MESAIRCGLEIHGYLNVTNRAKLFCNCRIALEAEPNTHICPVCTGQPGSKPMRPNQEAVGRIIAVAAMLDCRLNKELLFQRKHYDYPDLPNGYQRTMSGSYSVPVGEQGRFLDIGIEEVHLEEDPARYNPKTGLVDYNRSGLPLAEIVTRPEFSAPESVRDWLKKLMVTLSYIEAIDPGAGIKADVNLSVAPAYRRVEIKNVNSFRSIVRAIEYESARQLSDIREGTAIEQHTRAWDDDAGKTVFMRSKETAEDYMFIPEPDLPVIEVSPSYLKAIASRLPEKPRKKAERYVKKLHVPEDDANIISSDLRIARLFEEVAEAVNPALAARWIRRELLRVLNYRQKELEETGLTAKHLTQLLKMLEKRKITDSVAQRIIEGLVEKPFDVEEHVKKERLGAVSDRSEIAALCREAIQENPKAVEDYRKGRKEALHFLVGKVMQKTRGAATPREVGAQLMKILESP